MFHLEKRIFFPSNLDLHIKLFYDADCASCLDIRRFLIGYGVFLGETLVLKDQRSKVLSLGHQLKLNTRPWVVWLVKLLGCYSCSKI